MKSINEFATEYAQDKYLPVQTSQAVKAGANYVLSVLYDIAYKEDWITNPKDGIRRFFEIYRQLNK